MDRLKYWLLPVYIVVGFLALLLALPQSRWIVLSQVEAFSGEWRRNAGDFGGPNPNYVRPMQRGLEYDNLDSSPEAKFLQLLQPKPNDQAVDDYENRLTTLFNVCHQQGSPEYLAQFIRVASFNAQIHMPKDDPWKKPADLERRKRIAILIIWACEQAGAKDPQNAFFPLIASGAYHQIGEEAKSREMFLHASELDDYRDYVTVEPDLRYKYLVDHYGYRGNQLRAWIYMETILPHLAVVRSVAAQYSKTGNPADRVAAAKVGDLMMRKDRSLIGLLMGKYAVIAALNPDMKQGYAANKEEAKDLVKKAESLEALVPGDQGLLNVAKRAEALTGPALNNWPNEENIQVAMNMRPAWSGWSLLSLLLIPAALAVSIQKGRSETFANIAPYLTWGMALFAQPILGGDSDAGQIYGLTAFLFIPALVPKLRRFTDIVGIVISVIGAGFVLPPLAFAISLLVQRRRLTVPTWVTTAGIIACCLIAAGAWTYMAITTGGGNGAIFGTVFTLSLMCALPSLEKSKAWIAAGASCVVLGGLYGTMVYRDLAADRQLSVVCDLILNEANDVREEAFVK